MLSVARTFISTTGTFPTSASGSFLAQWSGNSSGIQNYPTPFGWDIGDGAGNVTIDNGTLSVSPQSQFVTIYNFQDQLFSSDISDLILVRSPQSQNIQWSLNVLVNETWVGLLDLQGLRAHQNSGVFAFQLSPGLKFKNPSITVTFLNSTLPGHVEFSAIEFGHIVNAGNVLLTMNGIVDATKTVFPANLTSNWPPGVVQTEFQFPPASMLNGPIAVVMSTEGGVSWTITAIILHIYVNTSGETPQAWTQLPYPLLVYGGSTGLLLAGSFWSLRRFFTWLKANTTALQNETPSDQLGVIVMEPVSTS